MIHWQLQLKLKEIIIFPDIEDSVLTEPLISIAFLFYKHIDKCLSGMCCKKEL